MLKEIYCYSKRYEPQDFPLNAKRIWKHYEQNVEDGDTNENSAGNHVRVVVDQMLKRSERRMENKMENLKKEVERHMERWMKDFSKYLFYTNKGW